VSSLESLINERATNKDFFWILLLRLPIYFWDFFGFFFFFFLLVKVALIHLMSCLKKWHKLTPFAS
jgi:hypothetical protein